MAAKDLKFLKSIKRPVLGFQYELHKMPAISRILL